MCPVCTQDILAIIPAFNEAQTVGDVVLGIKALGWIDVLVIDDHSHDQTILVGQQAGAKVISLASQMGTWIAIQTGFRYALQNNYSVAVTLDADGQHGPETIPQLIKPVKSDDVDMVIGSYPQRGSFSRHIAWSFFKRLSMMTYQDLTSGFKAYNRKAMRLLLQPRAYLFDYQDVGTLLLLKRFGLRVQELPVLMNLRQYGHSRIFSSWMKVFRYMLVTSVLCVCKWNQQSLQDWDV